MSKTVLKHSSHTSVFCSNCQEDLEGWCFASWGQSRTGQFLPAPLEVWLLHVLGARNPPQQELVYELGTDGNIHLWAYSESEASSSRF
jgi:predicted amidophosphoribosyltransferase